MKTKISERQKEDFEGPSGILEWAEQLEESGKLIVVEGPNDKKALESLGISPTKIFTLSKKPLFEAVEEVTAAGRKAVILTDFDKEGRKLYCTLNSGLQAYGVEVDNFFREWLQKNSRIGCIEDLHEGVSVETSRTKR
jgi:5S rRNA maturation endonuclease (ribonuclease M5)